LKNRGWRLPDARHLSGKNQLGGGEKGLIIGRHKRVACSLPRRGKTPFSKRKAGVSHLGAGGQGRVLLKT